MKILVAGGAGYLGSAVLLALRKSGHAPVVYDNLGHGHRQAVPAGVPLVVGDLGDRAALDAVFAAHRFDAVLHFAALIEAGESVTLPDLYMRNNAGGTEALAEAMARHGVRRLVFASSAAVYGDPERVPVDEDAPLRPTNPYGESKRAAERVLAQAAERDGLRYASLRYFNVAGAVDADLGEDHRPESHLIPLTLQVALGRRSAIAIHGTDYPTPDGTCVRDYVHVADLADAHLLALAALERHERLIYNLGNGAGFSVRQVIEAARRVTGHPIPAVEGLRRPGDPAILVASAARIERELGWRPRHGDLDAIVASAWEWHRRHPDGFAD